MVDEAIVRAAQNYLHQVRTNGIDARFGVLYGSQVTGTPYEWSDIDLVVVSPRFDGARQRKDIDLLWEIAALTDSRIEPIACGEKQWLEDDSSAIIEIARQEGVRIDVAAEKFVAEFEHARKK
ncbi:MAG: nucleotidyltransferase domain-containing protein [Chloroflexi bacterium]|nr:nucleotidyltransferase domain-containing protein [Chloroflexota bacterium]